MTAWKLETAGARLADVLKSAREEGPQQITEGGELTAVVLSPADYERLAPPKPETWVDRLRAAAGGFEIEIERDKDPGRYVDFTRDWDL